MSSIRIRPRFILSGSFTPEELISKIKTTLSMEDTDFYAESLFENFVVIKLKKEYQHFWSPQLSLSIEKHESGSLVRGLYGPRPAIWSMFVFLYIGIGVGVLFSALFGLAKMNLNLTAPILWLVPALLGLALLLYLSAQAGQKISAQQMFEIHHFFEKTLNRKVHIH